MRTYAQMLHLEMQRLVIGLQGLRRKALVSQGGSQRVADGPVLCQPSRVDGIRLVWSCAGHPSVDHRARSTGRWRRFDGTGKSRHHQRVI